MTDSEIKTKVATAERRLVFSRNCTEPNIEKLKKAFVDNNADIIECVHNDISSPNFIENLYVLEDKKLGKQARALVVRGFGIKL